VKARFTGASSVSHAIWMVADTITPHIDILNFNLQKKRKLTINHYWKNSQAKKIFKKTTRVKGIKPDKKFYIYTLEWTPKMLTWKINNIPVKKERRGIPDIPMFMNINSGVTARVNENNLPGKLELDWVRCYKENA
jgi:beta-glucanase (GH16 family)